MDLEKRQEMFQLICGAYIKVTNEFTSFDFAQKNGVKIAENKTFSVVVGFSGKNGKGRIILTLGATTAKVITESMNGGPLENAMETFLYLGEYANTFCGRAITWINNKFKDTGFRLTPPAIYSGVDMEIHTPSIEADKAFFACDSWIAKLDVGFEGV